MLHLSNNKVPLGHRTNRNTNKLHVHFPHYKKKNILIVLLSSSVYTKLLIYFSLWKSKFKVHTPKWKVVLSLPESKWRIKKEKKPKNTAKEKNNSEGGRRNCLVVDVNYLFMSNIVIPKHWKLQPHIQNNETLISSIK